MAVTLRDVARDAGVSVRTVSYVVTGFANISDETRVKVQSSIDRLGYRPNLAARNLRSGRTGLVCTAVPDIGVPYFSELIKVIVATAGENGSTVVIEETGGQPERERALIERSGHGALFDGLIMSPLGMSVSEISSLAGPMPIVVLGERPAVHQLDHVAIDNIAAARAATEHLISLGRKRIAAIGIQNHPSLSTAHLREEGFRVALASAGIEVREEYLRSVELYHRADGAIAMATLLELAEPPDAVFCFNDLLAVGALRAATVAGIRVPRDLAVIGFDGIEDTRFCTPALSTVVPDKQEIGRWAVSNLLQRIGGDRSKPREHITTFTIEHRESTGGRVVRPF